MDVCEFRPTGNYEGQDALVHIEVITEDNADAANGVRLYRDQSCGEKSQWSLKEFVEACIGPVEGDAEGGFELEFADLVDKPIWVGLSTAEFENKTRSEIDNWAHIDSELNEDGTPIVKDTTVFVDSQGNIEVPEGEDTEPEPEPEPTGRRRQKAAVTA